MKLPSLRTIILIGLVLRLLAAVFSQGYAMHDDHFVIEDGPMQWFLPDHGGWFHRAEPPGHSVVYPSILYGILVSCQHLGINEPQSQMLVIRLLHALFATLAIPLAAAITRSISSERSALMAALLVAVFWPLPFLSVRNLIEMMCIPPLLAGVLFVVQRKTAWHLIIAAFCFALAFMFRYHTAIIPGTMVIVLAAQRAWKPALALAVLCLLAVGLTQGLIDLAVWGSFLAAPIAYVKSNFQGMNSYTSGPWYQYVLLLIGLLIPPTSIMLLWTVGRTRNSRLRYEVVIPILVFVVAHSCIANKQERFLLPIVPLLLMTVAIAWTERPNARTTRWTRAAWAWFWVGNTMLLTVFTFAYSKRSRVESLTLVSHLDNVQRVAVVTEDGVFVPTFYLYPRVPVLVVSTDTTSSTWGDLATFHPSHVVFYDHASLNDMKARVEAVTRSHVHDVADLHPGILDATLHFLNPAGNKNEVATVSEVRP